VPPQKPTSQSRIACPEPAEEWGTQFRGGTLRCGPPACRNICILCGKRSIWCPGTWNMSVRSSDEEKSMDLSKNPELLKDKRGIIDGRLFFSKSPFLNMYFLIGAIASILCVLMAVAIALLHRATLSTGIAWILIILCGFLPICWIEVLRHIRRLRSLYDEGLINDVEAGSPMDIALGVAANAITESLASVSCTILFALFYLWILLDRINRI